MITFYANRIMIWCTISIILLTFHQVSLYEKVANDFDRYGSKIAVNDRLLVTVNNLDVSFYVQLSPYPSETNCMIDAHSFDHQTNEQIFGSNASCDFIYSVIVSKYHPHDKAPYFVYNCIDRSGNNIMGFYSDIDNNNSCQFELKDSRIVPGNYSTQENFVLCMAPDAAGAFGIADDFILYYNLSSFEIIILPLANFGLSPRALDIFSSNNNVFAIIAGYLQTADWRAQEMLYLVSLNRIAVIDSFEIPSTLKFSLSDPRRNRWVAKSRVYLPQNSISVSIASRTGKILVGVQSLNAVLLLLLNNATNPTGFLNNSSFITYKQNGVAMGYGKSVAWLDDDGQRAVILANNYSYATYHWISSSIHVYDIATDGFNISSQPINIYPNSEQILQPQLSPSFIRLVSSMGHVAIFDNLGTAFVLLSSPPSTYPTTFASGSFSVETPCFPGTYSDQQGIELCTPCPNGTYSSRGGINCSLCDSNVNVFCTYGAITPINYGDIAVPWDDKSYPESSESTIFDDILLDSMFTLRGHSSHCRIVSPITWVLVVIGLTLILLLLMGLSTFCTRMHQHRKHAKNIIKHMDLVGEGKMWIGGTLSAGIIVFLAFSYAFSNAYYKRYPIEKVGSNPWFGCHEDMRNAKFSSSMQPINVIHLTEDIRVIADMLTEQPFTLIVTLINTAFRCNDSITIQRVFSNKVVPLEITSCYSSYNESIISLNILLSNHEMSLELILPGVRTVGVIGIGINGPDQTSDDGRIILRELDFFSIHTVMETDHILAPLAKFIIYMTAIINETAPLGLQGKPIFSSEWSFQVGTDLDEAFAVENRYSFYKREKTIVSITLSETIFHVHNVQQPIARRNEIIFRNLLFTVVVLELFRLAFLLFKILFKPLFRLVTTYLSKKKKQTDSTSDKKDNIEMDDLELNTVLDSKCELLSYETIV